MDLQSPSGSCLFYSTPPWPGPREAAPVGLGLEQLLCPTSMVKLSQVQPWPPHSQPWHPPTGTQFPFPFLWLRLGLFPCWLSPVVQPYAGQLSPLLPSLPVNGRGPGGTVEATFQFGIEIFLVDVTRPQPLGSLWICMLLFCLSVCLFDWFFFPSRSLVFGSPIRPWEILCVPYSLR